MKRKFDAKVFKKFLREMGDTPLKEAIQDTNLLSNPEIMTPSLMDCYEYMMKGLNMGILLFGRLGSGMIFTAQLLAAKAKAVFKTITITYGTTVEDILCEVLGSLRRGEIIIFDGIECADKEIINFLDVILDPFIMLKCDKINNDCFYKFQWKGTWYYLNTNSYIILINNLDISWRSDMPITWKSRLMFENIPAETLGSFVIKMKAYDNTFSDKFYTLLFMLADYIEQAAKKFGFKFHPSIRYAQRFVRLIKSHLHYANFKQAVTIEYVNSVVAGEDTYPDSFEQHLKEAMGFDIIMKHLYDTYLEDCKESEKKEEGKNNMEEIKERMKKIKVPALTKEDFVSRMMAFDNYFSEEFYNALFDLEKYIEKLGYKFHFNIRHAQRFVQYIRTIKTRPPFDDFKEGIAIIYISNIVAEEDIFPESFVLSLNESLDFTMLLNDLYLAYTTEWTLRQAEDVSANEKERALKKLVETLNKRHTKKKEEEKKDMKETKITLKGSTLIHEVFEGLPPEIKQMHRDSIVRGTGYSTIRLAKGGIMAQFVPGGSNMPNIIGVYSNKGNRTTSIKFEDGSIVSAICDEEDTFDVEKGIAMALAKAAFGSKVLQSCLSNYAKQSTRALSKEDKEKRKVKAIVKKQKKAEEEAPKKAEAPKKKTKKASTGTKKKAKISPAKRKKMVEQFEKDWEEANLEEANFAEPGTVKILEKEVNSSKLGVLKTLKK